ncbi:MAG: ElyC/SanA/YdcF family protein [Verrucomicrobiota bacterium]
MNDETPALAASVTSSAPTTAPAAGTVVAAPKKQSGFWARRRSVLLPTWRLWLCLLGTLGVIIVAGGATVHSWLAVTEPVPGAEYLIIEGWVPDEITRQALTIADETEATRVFCTGQPLERGSYLLAWKSYAELTATTLAKLGMDPQRICPVPVADAKTDRTLNMALGLKAVLEKEPVPATGRKINLVSQGTHARRSRAIFQEVLGPEWEVGVYSIPNPEYNPARWYRQSAGVKGVISELSAVTFRSLGLLD